MKKIIIAIGIFIGQMALGHGESQLGPHKGYIRMPGAFHTEVVPDGNTKFKVYLLDINFKNPTVEKSKLEIKAALNDKESAVVCDQKKNYFACQMPQGFSLKEGKLLVNAVRVELSGTEVAYDLPLQAGAHMKMGDK